MRAKNWLDEQQYRCSAALFLLFLVALGGASSSWRLAVLSLSLVVFVPRLGIVFGAALLGAFPSVVEMLVHGDWLGPASYRLHTVAGFMVAGCALGLGWRLCKDDLLRATWTWMMPAFGCANLLQAVLRWSDAIPTQWQYLSGNHHAALMTAFLPFGLALRLSLPARLVTLGSLLCGIFFTGSRWGLFIAVLALLLMLARLAKGGVRVVCAIAVALMPFAAWFLAPHLNLSKAGLIKTLLPLVGQRPWAGMGPGGVELLQYKYHPRDVWVLRQTHAESLIIDWSATFGVVLASVFVVLLVALALWRISAPLDSTVERLRALFAIDLVALLLHDLFDFSWTSGAVSCSVALAVGILLPGVKQRNTSRGLPRFVFLLFLGLLLVPAHKLEPLQLEAQSKLDLIGEKWGWRPFRYWMNMGNQEPDRRARVRSHARAVSLAPGEPMTWVHLGDALVNAGHRQQALDAYRSALAAAPPNWVHYVTQRLARLRFDDALFVVQAHPQGRRDLALYLAKQGDLSLGRLFALARDYDDAIIRRALLGALKKKSVSKSIAVPLLWDGLNLELWTGKAGHSALITLASLEPRADHSSLWLRLIERSPIHCEQLAWWSSDRWPRLVPHARVVQNLCQRVLLGKSRALDVLQYVRVESGMLKE